MRHAAAAAAGASLAVALLLTGCAERSAPAAPPSPTVPLRSPLPAASTPGQATGAPVTLAVRTSGAPSIAGPRWSVASADPAAASVTVVWAGAPAAACGAVDSVTVTETATRVVIALGAHAREAGRICPMVLVPHTAVVPLAAPLGTRRLLEPVPRACPGPVRANDEAGRICPMRPA